MQHSDSYTSNPRPQCEFQPHGDARGNSIGTLPEHVAKNLKEEKIIEEKQEHQADQYNKRATDLLCLDKGDVVRMKPYMLNDKV